MSYFRRAGAQIARILASTVDPAAAAGELQLYSKLVSGVTQLFTRASDGTIYQVSNPSLPAPMVIPAASIITPAALSANQNNYSPAGLATATLIRQDITTSITITGLVAQPAGTLITLRNIKAAGAMEWITISHESGSSTAANRFNLPSRNAWYIPPGGSMTFLYDGTLLRWVLWSFAANNFPVSNSDGGPGLTVGNPSENIGLQRVSSLVIGVVAGAASRFRVSGNGADPNPVSYQSDSYFNALGQFRWASNANIGPLTGTINDQAIASATITARISTSGATTITGFTGGASGRVLNLVNLGPDTVTLNNEDAGSTAANRILLPAATFDILANAACQIWYDTTSTRWRKLS